MRLILTLFLLLLLGEGMCQETEKTSPHTLSWEIFTYERDYQTIYYHYTPKFKGLFAYEYQFHPLFTVRGEVGGAYNIVKDEPDWCNHCSESGRMKVGEIQAGVGIKYLPFGNKPWKIQPYLETDLYYNVSYWNGEYTWLISDSTIINGTVDDIHSKIVFRYRLGFRFQVAKKFSVEANLFSGFEFGRGNRDIIYEWYDPQTAEWFKRPEEGFYLNFGLQPALRINYHF